MAKNDYKAWRKMASQRIPALAPILYALSYHEDEKAGIGTFCVEPATMRMTYNPEFAAANTLEGNAFILSHEAGHVMCRHLQRRAAAKTKEGASFMLEAWVIAEEMAVNELVATLGGWAVPAGCVTAPDAYKLLTTEEIYAELRKQISKLPKCPGKCMHGNGDGKEGAGDPATEMIREQAINSAQKIAIGDPARQAGNQAGELKRMESLFKPFNKPPNLKQLLRRYLIALDTNCKHFDMSTLYRRRIDQDGLCLPNLSSSPIARKFVVSVDNSGSIGEQEFSEFKGILHGLAQQLGFHEIIVQHFTTQVMATERYFDIRQLKKMARQASGGTAIEDADVKAMQHKAQFHLILTDGYVSWLPSYSLPTVVIITQPVDKPPKVRNLIAALEMKK